MIRFIEKPNLPEGKVTALICGTDDEEILLYFARNEIKVIKNDPNLNIDTAVSTHADMAAIHLGKDRIIVDKNQSGLSDGLMKLGMKVSESEREIIGRYPLDIGLNFAVLGDRIMGKLSDADAMLLRAVQGFEKIEVKQGYCKCSVLIVNERAIITDDESIQRKASENGIESLLVSKGDISLDGHPYGFIGGASGKISKKRILFFGNIEKHRDFHRISAFLSDFGCTYECTDEAPLRDIGGIITLCEETDNLY